MNYKRTYLTSVEDKLGATCERFSNDHQVAQRWAVVDNRAVAVRDERLARAAAHNVHTIFVDRQPQILWQRRCVRL
jgi:hypothetical protein